MNVGIFGGTFDPIHLAHLRVAEEAGEALALERVVFVPSKLPPHKAAGRVAPPEERLALVAAAVADNPRFGVSEVELRRDGPSYTVDTVRELRAAFGPGHRLWLLMGEDAFREIHTWHRFGELLDSVDVAVLRRPPCAELTPPGELASEFEPLEGGFRHRSGREVRLVRVSLLDISSTRIRSALAQGRSIRYLVPDPVLARLQPPREHDKRTDS